MQTSLVGKQFNRIFILFSGKQRETDCNYRIHLAQALFWFGPIFNAWQVTCVARMGIFICRGFGSRIIAHIKPSKQTEEPEIFWRMKKVQTLFSVQYFCLFLKNYGKSTGKILINNENKTKKKIILNFKQKIKLNCSLKIQCFRYIEPMGQPTDQATGRELNAKTEFHNSGMNFKLKIIKNNLFFWLLPFGWPFLANQPSQPSQSIPFDSE